MMDDETDKRFIQFYDPEADEVVHQIDVTGKSERAIEQTMMGIFRLDNHREGLRVRDTAWLHDAGDDSAPNPSPSDRADQ